MLKVTCAWCGTDMEPVADEIGGNRDSHGVCVQCLGGLLEVPLTSVYEISTHAVDELPFGLIEIAVDGTVLSFNAFEEERSRLRKKDVVGQNFFRDVAPCTRNTEFENTFRSLVDRGGGDADFEFIFRFSFGYRLVRIRMIVEPATERQLIMVKDQSEK